MKVLHVVPYFSAIYGGPPIVVKQMSGALQALGVEVVVATTTAHGNAELDVPTSQAVALDGVPCQFFPRQSPKSWMFSWTMRRWLYRHAAAYDLVHVHGLFAYPTLPACAAARKFGKPYVITPHGVLDSWCLKQKWWKKRPYYSMFERYNLRHASAVHVTSLLEAEGLAGLGFATKTKLIPLSVSIPRMQTKVAGRESVCSLLFLSRLDPIKGLPVLLQAIALVRARSGKEIVLTIAGHGSDRYVSELHALVRDLNIAESVRFVGFLEGQDKLDALGGADVFVLPSYHENFSLAAAEALAAGLPVILSDQVGIAQEVHDAAAGLVVPADAPEALADAILKLADPEARRIAGANARKLAEDRFSQAQFGRALFNLYHEVLSRHAARDGSARGIT